MKVFQALAVFLAVLSFSACAPQLGSVKIESSERKNSGDDYEFSYSLSDGQSRYEKGVLTKVKTKGRIAELYEVIGFYSYIGADQKVYTVDYTAGANGFKATHTTLKALTPTLSKSARNVIRTAVES